ncbi:hypothetical protein VAWG006_21050 [Aeromonas enteropelogenes]|nr:hypothetical protein VAWG006_21050 [Aeromonas enteropelogenes]BEE22017.1 hypothetical protein VAWG007_21120 [Aeromonas enteropelogenes]
MQSKYVLEEKRTQFEEQGGGRQQSPGQAVAGQAAEKRDHLIDLTEETVAELEQSRGQKKRALAGPCHWSTTGSV